MIDQNKKAKIVVVFVRGVVVFVLGVSICTGILMSHISSVWAGFCSFLLALISLFIGMVLSGIKYYSDKEMLENKCKELEQNRQKEVSDNLLNVRKEMAKASVIMTKVVAEKVAGLILARHTRNLPSQEHIDAATKEASEMVRKTIGEYCELLKKNSEKEVEVING